jgi:hypothetical protein
VGSIGNNNTEEAEMPSEYDFLLPYSRGLRRTGRLLMVGGAFVAGVAATALIVVLPLRPLSNDKVVDASPEKVVTQDAKATNGAARNDAAASKAAKDKVATPTEKNAASTAHAQQQPSPQPRSAATEKPAERTTGSSGTWTDTQTVASPANLADRPRETTAAAAPANPSGAAPMPSPAGQAEPAPGAANPGGVASNDPVMSDQAASQSNEQPKVNGSEAAVAASSALSGEEPVARTGDQTSAKSKAALARGDAAPARAITEKVVPTPEKNESSGPARSDRSLSRTRDKPAPTAPHSERTAAISSPPAAEAAEKAARSSERHVVARGKDKPVASSDPATSTRDAPPPSDVGDQAQGRSEKQASREKAEPATASEPAPRRRAERAGTQERRHTVRRQEPRQDARGQTQERRYARSRDEQDGGREFVDDQGVRHIILPRRASERSDRTMAFEEPARPRRFFLFPPFGLDDDD